MYVSNGVLNDLCFFILAASVPKRASRELNALLSSTPGSYVSITKCATYMNKMYGSVQIALQKIREEKRLAGMLGSYVCIAC
jgi:hypothetical protein